MTERKITEKQMADAVIKVRRVKDEIKLTPKHMIDWKMIFAGMANLPKDIYQNIDWYKPEEEAARDYLLAKKKYFSDYKKEAARARVEGQPVLEQMTEYERVALILFRRFGNVRRESDHAIAVQALINRDNIQFINDLGYDWGLKEDNYIVVAIKG